jgi:hypothetical protein
MKVLSEVDGFKFPYYLSDNNTYALGLNPFNKIIFWLKVYWNFFKADQKLKDSIKKGVCFYGPFKGEFGHFTAHTLPFLMFLHKQGVKIIYCGMELHKPFMIDENGSSIVEEFIVLRDFFAEVSPTTNKTIPPKDVIIEIDNFKKRAEISDSPFWNIDDDFYYWFIHRNWLLKNHTYLYNIDKFYATKKENACCIFPRSKGAAKSHNNGERWDYEELVELIAPYFDTIYICGHPSQVAELKINNPKVEIAVSADNSVMLNKVSNSRLIITQHSGINNVGEFVNTQVLIIYKGGKTVSDIGSMNNTLRFRKSLGNKLPLAFAFSENEIVSYIEKQSENS